MQKQNLQLEMEKIIKNINGKTPNLLLHSCCGPCSSAVLEQLASHFSVMLLYSNSNIWPPEEYKRRENEQIDVLKKMVFKNPVQFIQAPYEPSVFEQTIAGLEQEPEGGKRCFICYKMRLEQAAIEAKKRNCTWFTTTLSVSPYKNADKLYAIGETLAKKYGVQYLPSNFKKKEGYKRSLQLSDELDLYRQEYCGCQYSYFEKKAKDKQKEKF